MVTETAVRLCACGCGQPLAGRSHQRFYSDGCRKRFRRAGNAHRTEIPDRKSSRETRTKPEPVPEDRGVWVSRSRVVYCAGCGAPMPRLEGPLPVAAYCEDCVAEGRCPCANRPAWHRWGRPR